jgi:hypothetical protein
MLGKPMLIALGAALGCFAVGAVLFAMDFILIGSVVAIASLPVALAVFVAASDRT